MRTYVQLGRYGDILTVLPLLWRDAQRGERSRIMVAKEFASVLEGVGYCDTAIFDGPYHEIGKACEEAEKLGGPVVCTQINGPTELVREFSYGPAGQQCAVCTSYQKEMWKLAGALKEWDEQYPLVFDRRDPGREAALVNSVLPKRKGKKKPVLLLALGGTTSPFLWRGMVEYAASRVLDKKYRVITLPHAERLYDLVGLMECADLMMATDSAPLHLARAIPQLPVIAFANDQPRLWNGSSWRPQHVAYCRYGDFATRYEEVMTLVEQYRFDRPPIHNGPVCHRVWNSYAETPQKRAAMLQPFPLSNMIDLPIEPGSCGRDSVQLLKDEKRVPYLKDCLRMGMQRARANDYIMLTRPGIRMKEISFTGDASYAYRLQGGKHFPVVDLFCAKKEWWKAHLAEIPDYLLGGDFFWSHGLWAIFKKHGAVMLPHGSVEKPV